MGSSQSIGASRPERLLGGDGVTGGFLGAGCGGLVLRRLVHGHLLAPGRMARCQEATALATLPDMSDETDQDLSWPIPVDHPLVQDWTTDFDHTVAAVRPERTGDLGRVPLGMPGGPHRTFRRVLVPRPTRRRLGRSRTTPTTSRLAGIIVNDMGFRGESPVGFAPPITSDPPFHQIARKLLLGPFSPKAVAALEPATREHLPQTLAEDLVAAAIAGDGLADVAVGLRTAHPRAGHRPHAGPARVRR